jgi:hypothetical protein
MALKTRKNKAFKPFDVSLSQIAELQNEIFYSIRI